MTIDHRFYFFVGFKGYLGRSNTIGKLSVHRRVVLGMVFRLERPIVAFGVCRPNYRGS